MKQIFVYGSWAFLYILCVGLGLVREPQGAGRVFLVLTGILFFLPGFYLLFQGVRNRDKKTVRRISRISLLSLSLTVVTLILNFLSVNWSRAAGRFLYELLVLVSSPMICIQYWVLSLFLWACLLVASLQAKV